jgi:hypothetical protein
MFFDSFPSVVEVRIFLLKVRHILAEKWRKVMTESVVLNGAIPWAFLKGILTRRDA